MKAISKKHPDIKMIFVTHLLGYSAENEVYKTIFPNAIILDDVCESHGCKSPDGVLRGADSIGASFSFYFGHHMTTIEGGMVSSNIKEIVDIARSFAWWGRDCYCIGSNNTLPCGTCGNRFDKWLESYDGIIDHKYVFSEMGYNLKPLDLQGAIGLVQLDKLDEIEKNKGEGSDILSKQLDDGLKALDVKKFIMSSLLTGKTSEETKSFFIGKDKNIRVRFIINIEPK